MESGLNVPPSPCPSFESISFDSLFSCPDAYHTLLSSLSSYVDAKLSPFCGDLQRALEDRSSVLVLGLLRESFSRYASAHSWTVQSLWNAKTAARQRREISLPDGRRVANFSNSERPFKAWVASSSSGGERTLVIGVAPGRDCVQHTAELVRAKMSRIAEEQGMEEDRVRQLLQVRHHPAEIVEMMKPLDEFSDVIRGSYVVLGYSEILCGHIQEMTKEFQWKVAQDGGLMSPDFNRFFGWRLLESSKKLRVLFMNMRHTFWGDLAYHLVLKIGQCGARGVIHGAKVGTLKSSKDVEKSLFVPDSFYLMDALGACQKIENLNTCMTSLGVVKGAHVSVPSIMCETKVNIDRLQNTHAYNSIDNEASNMAKAASEAKIQFGAVHFATDFLHVLSDSKMTNRNMLNTDPQKVMELHKAQAIEIARFFMQVQK